MRPKQYLSLTLLSICIPKGSSADVDIAWLTGSHCEGKYRAPRGVMTCQQVSEPGILASRAQASWTENTDTQLHPLICSWQRERKTEGIGSLWPFYLQEVIPEGYLWKKEGFVLMGRVQLSGHLGETW